MSSLFSWGDRSDLGGWRGSSVCIEDALKGGGEERETKREPLDTNSSQLTLPRSQCCLGLTLPSASVFACWLGLKVKIGFLWILANDFLAMGMIAFCCVCKMWIHSFLISVTHSKELNPIYKEIGSDKPWKYNVPLWLWDVSAGEEWVLLQQGNTLHCHYPSSSSSWHKSDRITRNSEV